MENSEPKMENSEPKTANSERKTENSEILTPDCPTHLLGLISVFFLVYSP
jgi:hypothetical protein